MAETWYYAEENEQKGPVNVQAIKSRIREGKLSTDTLVWQDGMATWQPLKVHTNQINFCDHVRRLRVSMCERV